MSEFESIIGLEVHIQLATKSKMFSGASTAFGAPPNTQACAIDLGMPGTLPMPNRAAIEMAVRFGLAINANIATETRFARKNYCYPDLPKGYQISQFEAPIVSCGELTIQNQQGAYKTIRITRAHLEEDAGKSLHQDFHGMSGIDFNRAGTPLLEIVSDPDLRNAEEAVNYLKKINRLVRYLRISDGDMSQGSMRCDANISVRRRGDTQLGTRTEIKNVNSYRFVEKAIIYEIDRQIKIVQNGDKVIQETRLYDAERNSTRPMRSKEEAMDYRYFADPDLLPLSLDKAFIDAVRSTMPELPTAKKDRYIHDLGINEYEAEWLTADRDIAEYFETCLSMGAPGAAIANWLLGDFAAMLNKTAIAITQSPIAPAQLVQLITRVEDGAISGKIAKMIFSTLWEKGGEVDAIIAAQGLKQISDTAAIATLIDDVLAAHPHQLQQYHEGKERLLGFFIGQVMKASRGRANPEQVNTLLREKLQKDAGKSG